jgi:uncharacterized protein DUF6049
MRSVRTVVRTLIAGFLAMAGPVLAAPALLAHAQEVQQHSSGTDGASSHQLTVSIDAVSPSFAKPASTITVRGTITNHTGSPVTGVQVQLQTQAQFFFTRSDMDSFAAGNTVGYIFPGEPPGGSAELSGTLHSGATARWSASFTAASAGYLEFGVYPLVAQAEFADGTSSGSARTFLPFWPGSDMPRPQRLNTAWIWPLIDQPQQGPCQRALATNELAASLGTRGRLGSLLAAGLRWGKQDHITWAVDPALLSDAGVMTHPYKVDANSVCDGKYHEPVSAAAATWLSSLATGAAGEPMFVTAYGDPDVAALTHASLYSNLRSAYQLGESVASRELSRSFGINGESTGDNGAPAVAWPADGVADASMLTNLASAGGISSVVLNSKQMGTTTPPWDNAIAATTSETGNRMNVLLADSALTRILGSAPAGSPASTQFAAEQDFLAQTAMIVAEAPSKQRSLVIAPPRRWDPPASEAARLLSMTHSAPWLHKADLGSLAAAAGSLKSHQPLPAHHVGAAELGVGFLDQVRSVSSSVATYKDLLLRPKSALLRQLNAAVAVMVSAAWRGTNSSGGPQALAKLSDYLSYWENKVQILTGTKLLLAGASGNAPVSVQNGGIRPVQVKLRVSVPANSQLSVGGIDSAIPIQAGKIATVRMTVNSSAIGTTQLQLQLVTKDGRPLDWTTKSMSVQATRYGRALLVLIGAALGVLVLTAVARWIRRLNGARAEGRSGGTG